MLEAPVPPTPPRVHPPFGLPVHVWLTLSTTMPLVPPDASTGEPVTSTGVTLSMLNAWTQPFVSLAVQLLATETKRRSVPAPTLVLTNSVKGEQLMLAVAESARR